MIAVFIETYLPWLGDMLELGGAVLILILFVALLMWGLILDKTLFLLFGFSTLVHRAEYVWNARTDRQSWFAQQQRSLLLLRAKYALNENIPLIQILIKLCPLLGLLGTVIGMLEVFDAVAATGANNPRTTAAGVSKATVSTMAGMVVAISGLLMSSVLARKIQSMHNHLSDRLVFRNL